MQFYFTRSLVLLACFTAINIGCNQKTATELPQTSSENENVAKAPKATMSKDLPPKELTLSEALQEVNDGTAVLVDVRSDGEWNESHFAQAQHISIDKINEDATAASAGLDKEKLVLLHCGAGGRASRAAKKLGELGFKVQALRTKYDLIKEAGFEEAQ